MMTRLDIEVTNRAKEVQEQGLKNWLPKEREKKATNGELIK